MARLFNVEVFNQTIGQSKAYYSGEEFNALLGSADSLFVQAFLDAAVEEETTVTVKWQTTNTLQEWTWHDTDDDVSLDPSTFAEYPMTKWFPVPGAESGILAYGRLKITTDKSGATVRVVVCGRSS